MFRKTEAWREQMKAQTFSTRHDGEAGQANEFAPDSKAAKKKRPVWAGLFFLQ